MFSMTICGHRKFLDDMKKKIKKIIFSVCLCVCLLIYNQRVMMVYDSLRYFPDHHFTAILGT